MNFRVIAIALISLAGMLLCVRELQFPEPTLISCTPPPLQKRRMEQRPLYQLGVEEGRSLFCLN
uniref:Uncharacterized protein n=1 Tax=Desertifilum tharense IPPAS B-1220 TaxID=1781255 RepID=A0ACD5GYJ7_9CYAN